MAITYYDTIYVSMLTGNVMAQQGNQALNPPQTQAQVNLQQMTPAQRQQHINQMVQQQQQQQQLETGIKQNLPNSAMQTPIQNANQTPASATAAAVAMSQMNSVSTTGGGINASVTTGTVSGAGGQTQQQQWNQMQLNSMNQMQATGPNATVNTTSTAQTQPQPSSQQQQQQFFNQGAAAGMNRFERPQMNNSKQALTMMLRQRHPSSFMNAANNNPNNPNNPQQTPNMGGIPFNIQQQRQQQLMRTAAMRNTNPAQIQAAAAAAAAANANQMNNLGNPMMSGGSMVQQRQVKFNSLLFDCVSKLSMLRDQFFLIPFKIYLMRIYFFIKRLFTSIFKMKPFLCNTVN